MKKISFYSENLSGHRHAYQEFAIKNFNGRAAKIIDGIRNPDLFISLMIEDCFLIFTIVALIRSLKGRKTVGLLFRPLPTIYSSRLKMKIKYLILRNIKKITHINILNIIPDSVEKRFKEITTGFIYDFQLWDLNTNDFDRNKLKIPEEIKSYIDNLKKTKKIIFSLGYQSEHKGINEFLKLSEYKQNDYVFILAGKIEGSKYYCINNKNLYVLDRYISDEELYGCYSVADFIWGVYSEDYDQASGVMGRAIQFGLPIILRENSLMHKFCVNENLTHAVYSFDKLLDNLRHLTPQDNSKKCNYFKNYSINKINEINK